MPRYVIVHHYSRINLQPRHSSLDSIPMTPSPCTRLISFLIPRGGNPVLEAAQRVQVQVVDQDEWDHQEEAMALTDLPAQARMQYP